MSSGPLEFLEAPFKFLDGFGVNLKIVYLFLGIGFIIFGFLYFDLESNTVIGFMVGSAPLWLPIITFLLFYENWLQYVRKEFALKNGRTTIEIKLPQEIFKSPAAMEAVLVQMYQTSSPDNHVESYIDGKHPPTASLELVSRGGDVRFYMNVPKKRFKDMWEVQLYAHYPGIEVHELDVDYTAEIPFDLKRFAYFMIHFGLKKPDAYPIKTYIEFGLDQMPKEEEKVDPINTVLEMLGSVGPGQHIWIQILIEANKKWTFKDGSLTDKPDWTKDAKAEIDEILNKALKRSGQETANNLMMLLTDTEKETIKAIERSIGKFAFNTIIRAVYICPADNVTIGEIVPRIISSLRVYDDLNRNALGVKWRTDFNWNWWQDPKGHKKNELKKAELDEYKRRVLNVKDAGYHPCVMTTEELATIFHLPGKVATTPSLGRIPSKRSEAPANLPIG